jgi:cell division protein FtsW
MRVAKRRKTPLATSGRSSDAYDKSLLGLTVLLTILGLVAVADVSAPMALSRFGEAYYFVRQQLMWAILGIIGLIVGTKIPYTYWKKVAGVMFIGLLILLVVVLLPGIGTKVLGARRWIDLGFFSIQPSEVAKLVLAIFIARLADAKYPWWYFIGSIGLVSGLIMLQPDLGTTIVVTWIGMIQLFIAGMPMLYLFGFAGAGSLLGFILIVTSDYRKDRLLTFLGITDDPLGTSYHIRQILLALGSGGLLGVGLGQSRQKHLFLPETATDSVFAVLGEELGFLGASLIILILTFFVYRIMRIAINAPDTFSQILVGGIAAWIGGQIFLNLAAMLALAPLTGIPLPFFSYGGSSLTMILFAIGITLNVSKHAKNDSKKS